MASSYSSEEIQAAVEKLVQGSIRRNTDALGARQVGEAFDDIQSAAATVLLLSAASPFYCLSLGAKRLRDLLDEEAALRGTLREAILATGRRVLPITTVDSLFSAKAALEELEGAQTTDVTKAPSYQRFSAATEAFLQGPALSVKESGEVVLTPSQARQSIPALVSDLKAARLEIIARASDLANGLEDFAKVDLPGLVARGAIAKARQVLGEHAEAMQKLTPEERLVSIRQVTLDVLAAKAVVREFGSFRGPSEYYLVHGVGGPYADSTHPATPPRLTSTALNTATPVGNFLPLLFDVTGGAPIDPLNPTSPSQTDQIQGAQTALYISSKQMTIIQQMTWIIGDGVSPPASPDALTPNNNELRVQVGETIYATPLTLSPDLSTPRTVDEVVSDINAGFAAHPELDGKVLARSAFPYVKYTGPLDIESPADLGSTVLSVPAGASDLIALGVVVGDSVALLDAPFDGALYPVLSVTATHVEVSGDFVMPALGVRAEMGPSARVLEIALTDPLTQCPAETKLTILGDTSKSLSACTTLGFYPGVSVRAQPTTLNDLAESIASQTSLVTATSELLPYAGTYAQSSLTNSSAVLFDSPMPATRWQTLVIQDGPNKGEYLVAGQGSSPNEVLLQRSLPLSRLGVEPLVFLAGVADKQLVLTAKTTTLGATLAVSGDGAALLFDLPALAYASTPYFRLPEVPKNLAPGDTLELYEDTYNVTSDAFEVLSVEPALKVIELDGLMSAHLADTPVRWVFDPQPPPFASLRAAMPFDFTRLQSGINGWLGERENQPGFWALLNSKLNPLLVHETPASAEVGDALALVTSMTPTDLEEDLASYDVPPVGAVDVLLKTYLEKGADRAVDLLLRGQFTTFFGLSRDESSYAGAMQASMREVVRSDLPVRKVSRTEVNQPRLLAEASSPDYDFDQSDIEQGAEVDPPER